MKSKAILLAGLAAAMLASGLVAVPSAQAMVDSPVGGSPAVTQRKVVRTAITTDLSDRAIARYGKHTSTTLKVAAQGKGLKFTWQYRSTSGKWTTIKSAKSAKYQARASSWPSGAKFRVIVSGASGTVTSSTAKLTVRYPTSTPAKDAETAFGLDGLTQGVDLSAYQYVPGARVRVGAIASWAGSDGFAILRTASGARPINTKYSDLCSGDSASVGTQPVTEDCAYPSLAGQLGSTKLDQGDYWFNGWTSSIDTTGGSLFAGGYSPTASAIQFIAWLKQDGNYTKSSTDPLVLDVEAGKAWTKSSGGRKYTVRLRAWNPDEVTEFLDALSDGLTGSGYHANPYVYMSADRASATDASGDYVWASVAPVARLWVASWGDDDGRVPTAQPAVGPWADYDGWSIWQYTSNARIAGDGVGALDADIAKPDAWTPQD